MTKPFNGKMLQEQAQQVSSAPELASFIRVLLADYRRDDGDWANISLGLYLRAMAAWIEDGGGCRGEERPGFQEAEWNIFAEILLAAKYYE